MKKAIWYKYFENKITRENAGYQITFFCDRSGYYSVERKSGKIGKLHRKEAVYKTRNYEDAENYFKSLSNFRIFSRKYKLVKEWKTRRKLFITVKKRMEKMIFLNIGWMKDYKGLKSDRIIGGGEFVRKYKYGHEIFNFLPFKGRMYGYAQPKHSIRLERLGANKEDKSIDGILAVWVSKSRIVGWYKNATIFRYEQPASKASNRIYKRKALSFFVRAKEEDCRRLTDDERIFKIPRGKGAMGQSNIWYADKPSNLPLKKQVLDFINRGIITIKLKSRSRTSSGRAWQPNPYKRKKIEENARNRVIEHYKKLGYIVDSYEKDNVGWDLTATFNDKLLRLEVKGLSQKDIVIELTPNEYDKMNIYREDGYRICIVTNALSKNPLLRIFAFSPDTGLWEDETGLRLYITPIMSARMTA